MSLVAKLIDPFTDANAPLWRQMLTKAVNTLLSIEDWKEIGSGSNPDFENSWANVGGIEEVAAFYKDPYNLVRVVGAIDTGSSGTTAFTLPTGYIPSNRLSRALLATGAIAGTWVVVNTDGTVVVYRSTGAAAFLDISFRV